MNNRKPTLLLHPLFIVSITLLLLNDFYWKHAFSNWFTGKLSDFAGMFALPVFLTALFPSGKKQIYIFSALFFIWWKSPLSGFIISAFNEMFPLVINRVVDYSDLIALTILPLAWRLQPLVYRPSLVRSFAIYASGIVAFISFCATSMLRHVSYYTYRPNEIYFYESYNSSLTEQQVIEKLGGQPHLQKDSIRFYRVSGPSPEDFYWRIKDSAHDTERWQPVMNQNDSALYIRKKENGFYTIPSYILGKDTLYNLELSLYDSDKKKKKTGIRIESFQLSEEGRKRYNDIQKRLPEKYRKHFKKLFKD